VFFGSSGSSKGGLSQEPDVTLWTQEYMTHLGETLFAQDVDLDGQYEDTSPH
jgi:hypothetical protein